MTIKTKYDISQVVFLRTDKEQQPFVVVEIVFDGVVMYGVRTGDQETIYRQEFELSDKEDKVFKLS